MSLHMKGPVCKLSRPESDNRLVLSAQAAKLPRVHKMFNLLDQANNKEYFA